MNEAEQQILADEIINKVLYCFHIDPIQEDITKDIDLSAREKSRLNKAHCLTSRRAAYSLLQTLCNNNYTLVPNLITAYFSGLLQ
jgi:hypothetical protein